MGQTATRAPSGHARGARSTMAEYGGGVMRPRATRVRERRDERFNAPGSSAHRHDPVRSTPGPRPPSPELWYISGGAEASFAGREIVSDGTPAPGDGPGHPLSGGDGHRPDAQPGAISRRGSRERARTDVG